MKKNTPEVQAYFNNPGHKNVTELYFVKGLPFHEEHNANAHAAAVSKQDGKNWDVVKVTRDEAFASDLKPEQQAVLAANERSFKAQTALGEANQELDAATKAQSDLPADATGPMKAQATKRVNKAKATLELATIEYNDALTAGETAAVTAEGVK